MWVRRVPSLPAGDQIDDRLQVADGAVAAGLGFGGLHEVVDGFHDAVGDIGVEPA